VTFTATVTAATGAGTPTGSVNFADGGNLIGTATLAGNSASFTTSSLTLGKHSITATYLGSAKFAKSTSQVLVQTVSVPADSLKLRALQLAATKIQAQASGQAISGAIGAAITEGFSEGANLITPSGDGLHFNFAAEPQEKSQTSAGVQDRIGSTFDALAYAPKLTKAPLPVAQPKDWLLWMDVRGTGFDDRQKGGTNGSQVNALVRADNQGSQINALVGVTRKLSPDLLLGFFGGYETSNYNSQALTGHLKGEGWTAGTYLGWRLLPGLRFEAGAARSEVSYEGTAGTASGSFSGARWFGQTGLAGTYHISNAFALEPSARVYMLWEQENQYVDSLGTVQSDRSFSTGRASVGSKVTYTDVWSDTVKIAPYIGLYSDYYFSRDDAAPVLIPYATLQGWSARVTSGLLLTTNAGARVSVGGELGGIGSGTFNMWSMRGRLALPF
jgi:hypothetical protein